MRVNELSKQIGKSNKEVLEILQKNHFDVKSHSSKVTEEQAEAVRGFLAGAKRQMTASKTDTGKAETNRVEDIKKEPLEAEKKEAEKTTEPPKKRIAAVYRPQNSVQRGSRPAGKANTGNAAKTGAPASRPAAASAEQTAEPAKSAAPAENRDGQRSGYQGNRDGQRSGGYQGNRDGQLREHVSEGNIVPVMMGSGINAQGFAYLLQAIDKYFPSPDKFECVGVDVSTAERFTAKYNDDVSLSALNALVQFIAVILPDRISGRFDNHAALYTGVIRKLCFLYDVRIPLGEIFIHRCDGFYHFLFLCHVISPC